MLAELFLLKLERSSRHRAACDTTLKREQMTKLFAVTAAIALLGLGATAHATITIDTVTVGDPGNVADTAAHSGNPNGQNSVDYVYNIGKYEVTAGQYTAFLNAVAKTDTYGLYNGSMWSHGFGCKIQQSGSSGSYSYSVAADYANRPVNYVSFWDACRFANWLHNGQPTGLQHATTTEDGTYTLNGYTGQDGRWIQRNASWSWAVTSEEEWYKAAYYKGGGTEAGYWLYPTRSDSVPGRDLNDASGNNANYYGNPYPIESQCYTTTVGKFHNSGGAYGTFDQGGNLCEWNEAVTLIDDGIPDRIVFAARGLRGGSFYEDATSLESSTRDDLVWPGLESFQIGFRVAHVPEPSSIIAMLGGLTGLVGLRRRSV